MDVKSPSEIPAIRVVMMPRDTNPNGTIFGGILLCYIDQAAMVEAMRQAHHRYVTVAMKEIVFLKPVFVGDTVSFNCETLKIGRTSMTIMVSVKSERFDSSDVVDVTEAEVVFVAVDDDGNSITI